MVFSDLDFNGLLRKLRETLTRRASLVHRACPRMILKCGVCGRLIYAGLAGLQLVGLVLMNKWCARELR